MYKYIEKYKPGMNDMIVDIKSNKKLNQVVTELFIKWKKTKYFYCFYHINLIPSTKRW